MINITYNDGIKVETGQIDKVFTSEQLPLTFEFKNAVSKKVVWHTSLSNFMWATYPTNEMIDVIVKDALGNFIYHHYWDIINHGSIFYKSLFFYCKSLINRGIKPNGLAIGTHDGEFGEWCPLVRYHLSDIVLVEASEKQFSRLKENYEDKQGITLVSELITPNGGQVEFFEGGKGYTNTVVERVIRYWEKEEINSTKRNSLGVNELIQNYFINNGKKLDWLHLDVEGLDGKLIRAIKDEYLSNFIIFEDFNLPEEEKKELIDWLSSKGYVHKSEGGICLSVR